MSNQLTFGELGLSEKTLQALNEKGFIHPTPIQALSVPRLLEGGCNLIAQAQTGTGKTAAFGLPLIELTDPTDYRVQAIVLSPTRELAIQITREIDSLQGDGAGKKLKVLPVYGGQSITIQLKKLREGVHIVVGTPGRVLDHLRRKSLDLTDIKHLILDEADEMLNMGFIEDMETIMAQSNPDKDTLLFSATMPPNIMKLARTYMGDYEHLKAIPKEQTVSLTEHIYYELKPNRKFEGLCKIIEMESDFYGMVFCRTKRDADSVAGHLIERGFNAEAIHGDISQGQREKILVRFRNKRTNILVATDVAARGIDVNDLTHVIHYSLPQDTESYVHRSGRTGRAGKRGIAASLIPPSDVRRLHAITRTISATVTQAALPTQQEMAEAKKRVIYDRLADRIEGHIDPFFYNMAKQLLTESQPTEILAAMLSSMFGKEIGLDDYAEVEETPDSRKKASPKKKGNKKVTGGARSGKPFPKKRDAQKYKSTTTTPDTAGKKTAIRDGVKPVSRPKTFKKSGAGTGAKTASKPSSKPPFKKKNVTGKKKLKNY